MTVACSISPEDAMEEAELESEFLEEQRINKPGSAI
jgi:hypothetical protein